MYILSQRAISFLYSNTEVNIVHMQTDRFSETGTQCWIGPNICYINTAEYI